MSKGLSEQGGSFELSQFWVQKVSLSVFLFCLSVSAVPIYNKTVFKGTSGVSHGLHKYPFPIATAFLQLGIVTCLLGVTNVAQHVLGRTRTRFDSWLFGPHFLYKLRHVAFPGVLFGLKYGVTNWGLHLVPVDTHVLLQSTDLIWTVAAARCLNREKLGVLETLAVLSATVGSLMVGLHVGVTVRSPLLALLVNLLTPLLLALCVSTLRSGAKELFDDENRLGGRISPAELTALKLALSSCVCFLTACILESGTVQLPHSMQEAWWRGLARQTPTEIAFLLAGGIFVLVFQVNITWLSKLTSAVTVGIVGSVKVVPQWFFSALFLARLDVTRLNVSGASLVLMASLLYMSSQVMHLRAASLDKTIWPFPTESTESPSGDGTIRRGLLEPLANVV